MHRKVCLDCTFRQVVELKLGNPSSSCFPFCFALAASGALRNCPESGLSDARGIDAGLP